MKSPSLLPTPTSGTIIINAVDRGCSWSYSLSTSFSFEYYLHTQAWLTCSYESGRTRLFAVGARVINGSHATNFTAISCKTSYVSTNGELSISLPPVVTPSTIPTIIDFKANTSSTVSGPPSWSIPYEAQLHQPAIVDNTATTSATLFGRLVFDFARSNFPDTYLQPEALSNATQLIFSSAYATLVAASTFKPAPQTRISGTLSLSATRLIVVPPVGLHDPRNSSTGRPDPDLDSQVHAKAPFNPLRRADRAHGPCPACSTEAASTRWRPAVRDPATSSNFAGQNTIQCPRRATS